MSGLFGIEPNQRSEWIRDDGQGLFVWSLPMGPEETEDEFICDRLGEMGDRTSSNRRPSAVSTASG